MQVHTKVCVSETGSSATPTADEDALVVAETQPRTRLPN